MQVRRQANVGKLVGFLSRAGGQCTGIAVHDRAEANKLVDTGCPVQQGHVFVAQRRQQRPGRRRRRVYDHYRRYAVHVGLVSNALDASASSTSRLLRRSSSTQRSGQVTKVLYLVAVNQDVQFVEVQLLRGCGTDGRKQVEVHGPAPVRNNGAKVDVTGAVAHDAQPPHTRRTARDEIGRICIAALISARLARPRTTATRARPSQRPVDRGVVA